MTLLVTERITSMFSVPRSAMATLSVPPLDWPAAFAAGFGAAVGALAGAAVAGAGFWPAVGGVVGIGAWPQAASTTTAIIMPANVPTLLRRILVRPPLTSTRERTDWRSHFRD